MRVEIDPSELQRGAYYQDEKCKEVEKLLQSDPRYEQCAVRRARWAADTNDDPFYVLDGSGIDIVPLGRWEVYALSGSEFISFVDVQRMRSRVSDRLKAVKICSAAALAFPLGIPVLAAIFLYYGDYESLLVVAYLGVLAVVILLLVGGLYYSVRRGTSLQMMNIDREAVEKDHSFLETLRKLTETPEADEHARKELVKRVRQIEDTLVGIGS